MSTQLSMVTPVQLNLFDMAQRSSGSATGVIWGPPVPDDDDDSHQCKGCGGSARWGDYCGSCAYERRRGHIDGPPHQYEPPALSTPGAQGEHLERVRVRIGVVILAFCRVHVNQQFHMDVLRRYVAEACGPVAPASPDRVLRQLRQAGRVQYAVISRRDSLYEVVAVNDDGVQEVA